MIYPTISLPLRAELKAHTHTTHAMGEIYAAIQDPCPLEILLHDRDAGKEGDPIRKEGWARKVHKLAGGGKTDYEVLWLKFHNGNWVTMTGKYARDALLSTMEWKYMKRNDIDLLDPDDGEDHPPKWWENTGRLS